MTSKGDASSALFQVGVPQLLDELPTTRVPQHTLGLRPLSTRKGVLTARATWGRKLQDVDSQHSDMANMEMVAHVLAGLLGAAEEEDSLHEGKDASWAVHHRREELGCFCSQYLGREILRFSSHT